MSFDKRVVAISAGTAVLVAGTLAAAAILPALAQDQPGPITRTAEALFPAAPKFDPRSLRKYHIEVDEDQVSTQVTHRDLVTKIAFGQRTVVSIVSTPTGTYSSDALVSPNVRYPGIYVTPKPAYLSYDGYRRPHFSSGISTSPYGTYKWSKVTTGSFTYYSSSFTPAR